MWKFIALPLLLAMTASAAPAAAPTNSIETGLQYINTSFENASPLYWETDTNGRIHLHLVYDLERSSPNRANGHWHFQLQGKPGSELTLVLHNFENVWNGKPGVPVSDKTICFVSEDGAAWRVLPAKLLEGNALQILVRLEGPALYVARLEPYRLSDLEKLKASIRGNALVEITPIGQTVEGRELEIIRVGQPDAPRRVLLRARAHPWEPGGNWVVEGLIKRLLRGDDDARRWLSRYCVYVMPIANKDGVARGRTRFNSQGKDLNRNWDTPADPRLAPENHALEAWIEAMIRQQRRPDLAIDLHNDAGGNLHVSRPEKDAEAYLARMKRFEELLRRHTWFTEGSTGASFRNPSSLGEGLLERYGITACIHELNANWIAGLQQPASRQNWERYGEQLGRVFYEYFAPESK